MSEPEVVVGFPKVKDISEEERLRRLKAEAERLANQPEIERNFRMGKSADVLGVSAATLKTAVTAVLKERAERWLDLPTTGQAAGQMDRAFSEPEVPQSVNHQVAARGRQ